MKIRILFIFICCSYGLKGQYASDKSYPDNTKEAVKTIEDFSYKIASTITEKELTEHLSTLSSDAYEGRETGSQGIEKAANYITSNFQHLNLPQVGKGESYFQKVAFTFTSWTKSVLILGNQKLKLLRDFVAFPEHSFSQNLEDTDIVFLGYGIDDTNYSDYKNIDISGKAIMVFDGEPRSKDGVSIITGSPNLSEWSKNHLLKSQTAKEKGASMLIIISNDLKKIIDDNRRRIVNRVTQLGTFNESNLNGVNTIFISPKIAEDVLVEWRDSIIDNRNKLISTGQGNLQVSLNDKMTFQSEVKRSFVEGNNLLGYIEGGELKDELVIVSAHYDHVGTKGGEVYNGADDNASGTTAVLELAEAFAIAKRLGFPPKRSVLFLLVTGEEKGLLGSEFYSENPIFPISKTIANINIDMVGRWGKEYEQDKNQPYIYVIGSDRISQDLHDINESVNNTYSKLLLDYKYNDEKDPNRFYYRSDHYNFAKKGIPAIFFFNGVHNDYHRLTDTIDKIDFSLMTKRVRHIFHLTWNLANRKERIKKKTAVTAS